MKNVIKFYKNRKILITGATGFKGAWLCSWLLKMGAKIYGVGFTPNKNKNLFYNLLLDKKIILRLFDIRNFDKLNQFIKFSKPSIIFHLAGQPLVYESYKKPLLTFDVNSRGTLNVLEASKNSKFVRSIVSITSDKCYENVGHLKKTYTETDSLGGLDPYSASKASAELIIKSYRDSIFKNKIKCGISSARAGNVIGGGDWSQKRLIPDCIRFIRNKSKIKIRNPNFSRGWQFVLEPLKGYLLLAKRQYENPNKYSSAWNFGPEYKSIKSVREIVELIVNYWGSGSIKVEKNKKFYEQHYLKLDIKKAKKYLKWKPTYDVEESVNITVDWYYKVLNNKENPIVVTNDQIDQYMHDNNH
jgi:CDP-glucose 4,6-dehydratase